ncbi:MAG: exonuclease domain-containing protein [Lachnospiraceae bacterium]|nr:exonuclease domain-containing protein [Lachnospiraceae bacterium]
MRKIFIDLEMNPFFREEDEERKTSGYEIIEIGALMLDDNDADMDSFKMYVKPQYNQSIDPHITRLTGITYDMVAESDDFYTALNKFIDWCADVDDIENIYSWSDSDLRQIKGEIELKQCEVSVKWEALFDKWKDFQKQFSSLVGLSRKPMGLKKAIEAVGRKFEGTAHDALTDAINTARLYVASKNDEETKRMISLLEKTRKPVAPLETALGDLFDFNNFDLDE